MLIVSLLQDNTALLRLKSFKEQLPFCDFNYEFNFLKFGKGGVGLKRADCLEREGDSSLLY